MSSEWKQKLHRVLGRPPSPQPPAALPPSNASQPTSGPLPALSLSQPHSPSSDAQEAISQPSPSEQEICSVLAQLQLDAEGKPTSEGKQTLRRLFKLSCKALSKVNEVAKLVPPAAPYAPIVDVLLGVASVWPYGVEIREQLTEFVERLCAAIERSFGLREEHRDELDDRYDKYLRELTDFVKKRIAERWTITIGMWHEEISQYIEGLDKQLTALHSDYAAYKTKEIERTARRVLEYMEEALPILRDLRDQLPIAGAGAVGSATGGARLEDPPPSRPLLLGRDDDLGRVVHILAGQTEHVVLVGAPGIGKTTLTLNVLHSSTTTRKLFVRCEALERVGQLESELGGLAKRRLQPHESAGQIARAELAKESTLLVLDNLIDSPEDLEQNPEQRAILDYVKTLAELSSTSLLITTRNKLVGKMSTVRRIRLLELEPLDSSPSEKLFRDSIGAEDMDRIDTDGLDELMRLLGGVALAIKLVAIRAREEASVQDVIEQFKSGQSWGDHEPSREESLKASFDFSLNSGLIKSSPRARDLLVMLAHLPSGILRSRLRHSELGALLGDAAEVLWQTSLAYHSSDKSLLSILAPVREYVRQHLGNLDDSLARALMLGHLNPAEWERWQRYPDLSNMAYLGRLECVRQDADLQRARISARLDFAERCPEFWPGDLSGLLDGIFDWPTSGADGAESTPSCADILFVLKYRDDFTTSFTVAHLPQLERALEQATALERPLLQRHLLENIAGVHSDPVEDVKRYVLAAALGPADYFSCFCWTEAARVSIAEATRSPDIIVDDHWNATVEHYLEQADASAKKLEDNRYEWTMSQWGVERCRSGLKKLKENRAAASATEAKRAAEA